MSDSLTFIYRGSCDSNSFKRKPTLVSFEPRPPLWNHEWVLKIETNTFNVTAAYTKVNGCLFLTCCSSVITPKWKYEKKIKSRSKKKVSGIFCFLIPQSSLTLPTLLRFYLNTQHVYFFQVSSKIPGLNSNSSFPNFHETNPEKC